MIESKYLKDNIENIQKLMAIPTLRNFETKSLRKLLKLSKIREYEDGEAIIREGDRDTWLYFLLSGKIRIAKDDLEIGVIDKKGEIFGEMRIIDSMHRSATVSAVGKTVALAVDSSAKNRFSTQTLEEEKLDRNPPKVEQAWLERYREVDPDTQQPRWKANTPADVRASVERYPALRRGQGGQLGEASARGLAARDRGGGQAHA